MDKELIIECLEDDLAELKREQLDFVRYLNDGYGMCLDEHNPPIDLFDLYEDGVLDMSIFDMFPSEIVDILKWHSRSWVISSLESTIDYIKQTTPRDECTITLQIAQPEEDLQEIGKGV